MRLRHYKHSSADGIVHAAELSIDGRTFGRLLAGWPDGSVYWWDFASYDTPLHIAQHVRGRPLIEIKANEGATGGGFVRPPCPGVIPSIIGDGDVVMAPGPQHDPI